MVFVFGLCLSFHEEESLYLPQKRRILLGWTDLKYKMEAERSSFKIGLDSLRVRNKGV